MQENQTQALFLARINNFEPDVDEHGCYTRAQVVPTTSPDVVTRPFSILWICRGKLGDLHVNDLVVCGRFPDGSGIIICRADGESTNTFPKDLTIEGDVQIDGDVHVDKTLTADADVVGGGKSLASHTHTDSHGGSTSAPN